MTAVPDRRHHNPIERTARVITPQLPFDFDSRPALSGDDFLVSDGNAEAVSWLDRWPDWRSVALVVYGPPGSGKSHLARVFQSRAGARDLTDFSVEEAMAAISAETGAYVLDDALSEEAEEGILHVFNAISAAGGNLLVTDQLSPSERKFRLNDLASRLRAAPSVALGPPDEDLLSMVLVKLFSDRQLRVDAVVVEYLVRRIERSFQAARDIVERIDREALAANRGVTLPLVREVLRTTA